MMENTTNQKKKEIKVATATATAIGWQ